MRDNSIKGQIIMLVGVFIFATTDLFWATTPNVVSYYTQPSLQLSSLNMFHSLTVIGEPLLLLGIGAYSVQSKNPVAKAAKFWLYTFFCGLLMALVYFLVEKDISAWLLYGVFLPILRNTYPIITGIIMGLVLLPFYQRIVAKAPYFTYVFLGIIFLLPMIFDKDIFGTSGGDSIVASLALFYLGSTLTVAPLKLTNGKVWCLLSVSVVLQLLLAAIMPTFSMVAHNDLNTIGRFYTATSFLTVALAVCLFLLLKRYLGFEIRGHVEYLVLSVLVISNLNDVINMIIAFNDKVVGKATLKVAGLITLEVVLGLSCIFIINFILINLPFVQRIGQKLTKALPPFTVETADQWLKERLVQVRDFCQSHMPYLSGLIGAYILACLSFLCMNTSWSIEIDVDVHYNIFAYTLGARQIEVLLTTVVICLLFKFVWALTDRYWLSEILVGSFVIIWTVANRLKIETRSEPIIPSELAMVKALGSLLSMVESWIVITALCVLALAVAWSIYLEKKYPFGRKSWPKRLIWVFVPILFFSSSFYINHPNSYVRVFMDKIGNLPTFYNQLAGAQRNGPILQFMNNLDVEIMAKPAGYSEKTMQEIARRYTKRAQQINKTRKNNLGDQIVIFGLSESFADPMRIPGLALPNDPIPYVRSSKQETTSGYMLSSGYGGGTANMEYMTLTGLNLANFSPTLPTPYTQLVSRQSYAPNITQYFPESVAIHPYIGVYYNRQSVYQKFGFDRFMYLGSQYPIKYQKKIDRSPYLSDETAYKNTLAQIKQAKSGLFINLVTMQNHYPYNKHYYNDSNKFEPEGEAASADVKTMVKDYATGLSHSDKAVQEFIKQIDQIDKPITFVFYGDHLPGIYPTVDMKKYGLTLHETDYFIYSNAYAQKLGARKLTKATQLVTPTDFPALTTEQTNAKISAYYALLTDVTNKLPALTMNTSESTSNSYNTSLELIDEKGAQVTKKELTQEQKQILHDYQLVQYDITAGKQYLAKENFDK